MAFSEGMTEDDEVYGKIAREVMRSMEKARNVEGAKKAATAVALSAAGPFIQMAYHLDPKNRKAKKSTSLSDIFKSKTDVTNQPGPDYLWRGIEGQGGRWKKGLDPRFHHNPAYMQNGVSTDAFAGFPKVFGALKTGGYGYRWPESKEEHSRFRGTIPGTDIPYGPPRIKSDADRAEVNEAYNERRKWLLQMIRFWQGRNPTKAANYMTELENLSSDPKYN